MEPTKKDIQKWIDALRSGLYKQGRGHLQTKKGYCCLGVACDIFIPKERQIRDAQWLLTGDTPYQQYAPYWLTTISANITSKVNPGVPNSHVATGDYIYVPEWNDKYKYTFDEIADILQAIYIEKVLG